MPKSHARAQATAFRAEAESSVPHCRAQSARVSSLPKLNANVQCDTHSSRVRVTWVGRFTRQGAGRPRTLATNFKWQACAQSRTRFTHLMTDTMQCVIAHAVHVSWSSLCCRKDRSHGPLLRSPPCWPSRHCVPSHTRGGRTSPCATRANPGTVSLQRAHSLQCPSHTTHTTPRLCKAMRIMRLPSLQSETSVCQLNPCAACALLHLIHKADKPSCHRRGRQQRTLSQTGRSPCPADDAQDEHACGERMWVAGKMYGASWERCSCTHACAAQKTVIRFDAAQ